MNPQGALYPWQSRMIEELQLVFTVKDKDLGNRDIYTQFSKYTGDLINLLQWQQQRDIYSIYCLIKVESWPMTEVRNQEFLIKEKIYSILLIIRRGNMVLAIAPPIQYWFINNYINCDQYNTLYDKNFKRKMTYIANKITGQFN